MKTADEARAPPLNPEDLAPTPEEMNAAREVMQEVFSTTLASAYDSGRGWPEEAHLHPIVKAGRAERARGRLEAVERAALEVRAIGAEVEDGEDVVNLCDELERRIRALASGNPPKAGPSGPSGEAAGPQVHHPDCGRDPDDDGET